MKAASLESVRWYISFDDWIHGNKLSIVNWSLNLLHWTVAANIAVKLGL